MLVYRDLHNRVVDGELVRLAYIRDKLRFTCQQYMTDQIKNLGENFIRVLPVDPSAWPAPFFLYLAVGAVKLSPPKLRLGVRLSTGYPLKSIPKKNIFLPLNRFCTPYQNPLQQYTPYHTLYTHHPILYLFFSSTRPQRRMVVGLRQR